MARCRACGAPVSWALTEMVKRIPVDAHADDQRGNLRLWKDATGRLRAVHDANANDPAVTYLPGLYTAHFETCEARRHDAAR